jgi:hypothetical protein
MKISQASKIWIDSHIINSKKIPSMYTNRYLAGYVMILARNRLILELTARVGM